MRLPITLLFVLATLSAFSQSRKGHFYLSGNTSLSAVHVFPEQETNLGQFGDNQIGDEEGTTWGAQSSRIGYFITNRLLLGTDFYLGSKINQGAETSNYFLNPFVRFYLTDQPGSQLNLFAQLGFGTIGEFGFGSNFETNFHLGVGLEARLSDDVAVAGMVRHNANALGLNYTELELQLSTFLGGGLGNSNGLKLSKGSLMLDPSIGGVQVALRNRDATLNLIADLNVSGGYFFHDRWMVEAGFALNSDWYTTEIIFNQMKNEFENTQLEFAAIIGTRYFVSNGSRLKPYLLGRTRFSQVDESISRSFGNLEPTVLSARSDLHLQAGAGTLLSLSNHVALDGEILYGAPISGEAQREVRGRVGLKVFLLDQH